jgi:hypothetical protein
MTTTVINIKDAPEGWKRNPNYVYIGRPGKGFSGNWGNPFPISRYKSREESLEDYTYWLNNKDLKYLEMLRRELKGKTLVCFCKPLDCHGDIIAELVDKYWEDL